VTRRKFRTEDPKGLGVTDLAPDFVHPWKNRVREGIVGYRFVFQSFWYVRTIFLNFFAPKYHVTFFIWLAKMPKILRQV